MTVKELITLLQQIRDQNAQIFMGDSLDEDEFFTIKVPLSNRKILEAGSIVMVPE